MLPLGHAAFAYLFYVVYAGVTSHRLPARWALLPLFFGSQFPDLVDKPLAYWGVLYSGRSLGHSVFTLVFLSVEVYAGCRLWRDRYPKSRTSRTLARFAPAAFSIAYASHLLGDSIKPIMAGDFWKARFLLWPLFPVGRSAASDIPPWTRMLAIYQDMGTHPQVELIVLALLVFIGIRARSYIRSRSRPAGVWE